MARPNRGSGSAGIKKPGTPGGRPQQNVDDYKPKDENTSKFTKKKNA